MALFGLSNTRALTTISDSVHHAIDINIFERELIDSQYFQRLHFILQNSTTFVSYPSNKNTRFPHSLGVAHVAGEIFSKSLSNASPKDLRAILAKMKDFLLALCGRLEGSTQREGAFEDKMPTLDEVLAQYDIAHTDTISGLSGFLHNPLHSPTKAPSGNGQNARDQGRVTFHEQFGPFSVRFIVDTYWQAVRLYALMHDIGHLPMSHSFEAALESQAQLYTVRESEQTSGNDFEIPIRQAYDEYEKLLTERRNEYKSDAAHYLDFFQELLQIPAEDIEAATFHKAFHEVRGISIFNRHARKAGPGFPEAVIPYRRLVNHLCLAIIYSNALAPENTGSDIPHKHAFLYTFKSIVDGELDADRLDYTIRDGLESGTDLGTFDLRSIVSHAILVANPARSYGKAAEGADIDFTIAYHHRATTAIEQFYEARYQTYKYIIYHRTCSRSNKCLEYLIALLINYSFIFPKSTISNILSFYGYIRQTAPDVGGISALLPDQMIDDANLRTMLSSLLSQLSKDTDMETGGEAGARIREELKTLLEVVLYRNLAHVFTLHKRYSVEAVVARALRGVRQTDLREFVLYLESKYEDLTAKVRLKFNRVFPVGKAVSVIVDLVKPKVYNARALVGAAFEERLFISRNETTLAPIEVSSASLRNMRFRIKSETHFRVYVVTRDIKFHSSEQQHIERLFDDFILETWNDYQKKGSSGR